MFERLMVVRKLVHGTALRRGLAFAFLWWVLSEGSSANWGVGVASVMLATGSSVWLWPPGMQRIYFTGLLSFAGFFLVQSIKAGVQVAVLALRPRSDLAPAVLDMQLSLPVGPATVLLVDTLSLLPGTLSVRIEGDLLRVHVLDVRRPVRDEVRAAEAHVARLFGLQP